jgi:hypothetical protein
MGKGSCLREGQFAQLNLAVAYSHSGRINEAVRFLGRIYEALILQKWW